MVEWKLQTRRTRNPGGDPRAVIAVTFGDGAALQLRYRPEVTACQPGRRVYDYRIIDRADASIDAGQVRSGVGEDIDLPRALAALTSFLCSYADRYDHAHRHGGGHPDGEPVTGVHEWASQHSSDLELLNLELSELPAASVPTARLAPPQPDPPDGRRTPAADQPPAGEGPYRIAMVSVRGGHHIAGAGGCVDLEAPPPAGVGHTYGSVEQAKAVVVRHWSSLTVFWQFRILDATGATVAVGFRAGPNGTGTTIGWER